MYHQRKEQDHTKTNNSNNKGDNPNNPNSISKEDFSCPACGAMSFQIDVNDNHKQDKPPVKSKPTKNKP